MLCIYVVNICYFFVFLLFDFIYGVKNVFCIFYMMFCVFTNAFITAFRSSFVDSRFVVVVFVVGIVVSKVGFIDSVNVVCCFKFSLIGLYVFNVFKCVIYVSFRS